MRLIFATLLIIFSSAQDSESVGRCVGCGRTLLGLRTIQRSQPGSGLGTQDKDAREYLVYLASKVSPVYLCLDNIHKYM